MRVKIFQIDGNLDENKIRFTDYGYTQKHGGIDESKYREVFYGDIEAEDLEDVYKKLNAEKYPPTYRGQSLSTSDIVKIVESERGSENGKYFFCDSIGFKTVNFDESKACENEGMRCVYLTPGNKPIVLKLPVNKYETLSNAVGGLIEITHPFNDNIAVIGNEEAKLIGMKGNRRTGSSIYAGPMLIVGDNGGEDFDALTKKQAQNYTQLFAEPEEISDEEVQSDMGFVFYGFNY